MVDGGFKDEIVEATADEVVRFYVSVGHVVLISHLLLAFVDEVRLG